MPGHVKRGGTGEPDPDPSPFLFVSWEDKQNDMAKVKRYELYKSTIRVSYRTLYLYLHLFLTDVIAIINH